MTSTETPPGRPWLHALAAGGIHGGCTVLYVAALVVALQILEEVFYLRDPLLVGDLLFAGVMAVAGTLCVQAAWGLPILAAGWLLARKGRARFGAVVVGVVGVATAVAAINLAVLGYGVATFRP